MVRGRWYWLLAALLAGSAHAQWAVIDFSDLPFDIDNLFSQGKTLATAVDIYNKTQELYQKSEAIRREAEEIYGTLDGFRPEALFRYGTRERTFLRRYMPDALREWDQVFVDLPGSISPISNTTQEEWARRAVNYAAIYELGPDPSLYQTNDRILGSEQPLLEWRANYLMAASMASSEMSLERSGERMDTMEDLLARLGSSADAKESMDLAVRAQAHGNELDAESIRLQALVLRLRADEQMRKASARVRSGQVLSLRDPEENPWRD